VMEFVMGVGMGRSRKGGERSTLLPWPECRWR
jgi:hypothetical protein